MPEDFVVSVSQLKKFKKCPRQWNVQYDKGLRKRREERSEALRKGSALHRGIELLHGGGELADALKQSAELMSEDSFSICGNPVIGAGGGDTLDKAWTRAVIRAYATFERVRQDEPIGKISHPEFAFGFRDAKYNDTDVDVVLGEVDGRRILLMGKVDGWDDARKECFEHKTAKSLSAITIEDLALDDQVSAMLFAMGQITGEAVLNMTYNVIQKPCLKFQPKTPKNLRQESLDSYEYRVAMHMLASPARYFARMRVTRTIGALEQWREDAMSVVRAMLQGIDYPALHASWGGPCHWCDIRPACEVWHDKKRVARIFATEFTTREQREAEKKEKEALDGGV